MPLEGSLDMATKRENSSRVHPETNKLLRQLAKRNYGSERKAGYVIDDAVKAYFTNETRPTEASAIISTTEQILLDRLERRMNSIFDDVSKGVVNRLGNLYAKTAHDSAVTFVMMEDLFLKTGGTKDEVGKLRGDATRIIKKRLDHEDVIKELTKEINDEFSSNNEVEQLKKENEALRQKANALLTKLKAENEQVKAENERIQKENDVTKEWYKGLEDHLIRKKGISINNAKLIEEYKSNNPMPVIANG